MLIGERGRECRVCPRSLHKDLYRLFEVSTPLLSLKHQYVGFRAQRACVVQDAGWLNQAVDGGSMRNHCATIGLPLLFRYVVP